MPTAVLAFPHHSVLPDGVPDLAFTARGLLAKLRDRLNDAAKRHRRAEARRKDKGVPPLFFFDELKTSPPLPPLRSGEGELELQDLLDDAHQLLAESYDVRRMARAVTGLAEAAKTMAGELAPARDLAELLRMPEDEAIRAIHPGEGFGYRIMTRGVATVAELHAHLADEDDRPFAPRFQFLKPSALRRDGSLPEGFDAADHWIWNHEPLADLPRENGERIVLLHEPTLTADIAVSQRFPMIPAEFEVLEELSRAEVQAWLADRCPAYAPPRRVRERIAA